MPFLFKQFAINHENTALKVTTEACILGAYTTLENATTVLDIGTGTGILALMLAQKSKNILIDAVEIEENAFKLAVENVNNSIFKNQINVFHNKIQTFNLNDAVKYDLIVSNPPFYENHLKSSNTARNLALHTQTLNFDDLLNAVIRLLNSKGRFVVMLPQQQMTIFNAKAEAFGLQKQNEFKIHHRQTSKVLRIITTFGYKSKSFVPIDFIIKDNNEQYTPKFTNLLKDYYLKF